MKLTTEELDKLADIGAAAAYRSFDSALLYVDCNTGGYAIPQEISARRAFVEAVIANLPESTTDWPLTRDAFASRGITTDEAAADWVSITHDTRVANAPLTFGNPPEGWEWHNPEGLTPEQVEVDKGWRLLLVGETVPVGYQYVDEAGLRWHSGEEWFSERAGVGLPIDYWVKNTYRTRKPLPAPITPAEAAFNRWWTSLPDRAGKHRSEAREAWIAATELSLANT